MPRREGHPPVQQRVILGGVQVAHVERDPIEREVQTMRGSHLQDELTRR